MAGLFLLLELLLPDCSYANIFPSYNHSHLVRNTICEMMSEYDTGLKMQEYRDDWRHQRNYLKSYHAAWYQVALVANRAETLGLKEEKQILFLGIKRPDARWVWELRIELYKLRGLIGEASFYAGVVPLP
jgi:hypothetical protein